MKISSELTDEVVLKVMGERLSRMRISLNLTQAELANQAGVSKRTLERLESGAVASQLSVFLRVCRALGLIAKLELFLPEPKPGPMELLLGKGVSRSRARTKKSSTKKKPWTWAE